MFSASSWLFFLLSLGGMEHGSNVDNALMLIGGILPAAALPPSSVTFVPHMQCCTEL